LSSTVAALLDARREVLVLMLGDQPALAAESVAALPR